MKHYFKKERILFKDKENIFLLKSWKTGELQIKKAILK
jgi:hypothetical protein